jgi:hypothetical protein
VRHKNPNMISLDIPLEQGFHEGLDILFPPKDDDWWKGDFTHFDFNEVFNEIAKSVPITMANESFKEIKWIVKSTNRNEPAGWNESELTFFSEYFMNYFLKKGRDPRLEPEVYLLWYCHQMDRSDIEEGIFGELEVVLGEDFAKDVMSRWDVDLFIATLEPKKTDNRSGEKALVHSKPLIILHS